MPIPYVTRLLLSSKVDLLHYYQKHWGVLYVGCPIQIECGMSYADHFVYGLRQYVVLQEEHSVYLLRVCQLSTKCSPSTFKIPLRTFRCTHFISVSMYNLTHPLCRKSGHSMISLLQYMSMSRFSLQENGAGETATVDEVWAGGVAQQQSSRNVMTVIERATIHSYDFSKA